MLKSPRDPREAKLLVRLECGVLMAMFVMQLAVCAAVLRRAQLLGEGVPRPGGGAGCHGGETAEEDREGAGGVDG
ncbi:UNVERIFIED_CONTAM: hypothetical protein Sradi_5784800 [Sesamum radiatum]|uniref:Uncharacterized protein n=1 Tax=Sesamum radiatum TaxID=300843 RepID=A0AAW2KQY7_SESRA